MTSETLTTKMRAVPVQWKCFKSDFSITMKVLPNLLFPWWNWWNFWICESSRHHIQTSCPLWCHLPRWQCTTWLHALGRKRPHSWRDPTCSLADQWEYWPEPWLSSPSHSCPFRNCEKHARKSVVERTSGRFGSKLCPIRPCARDPSDRTQIPHTGQQICLLKLFFYRKLNLLYWVIISRNTGYLNIFYILWILCSVVCTLLDECFFHDSEVCYNDVGFRNPNREHRTILFAPIGHCLLRCIEINLTKWRSLCFMTKNYALYVLGTKILSKYSRLYGSDKNCKNL